MAAPVVQPIGNGQYRTTVNGHTYTFSAAPGVSIIVGGQRVTTPAQPTIAPGTPHLTPDEQFEFNQQLDALAAQEIDLNYAQSQGHVNYERSIADLARNALINTQHIEESMASRGQYDSGLRSAALVDLATTKALTETRAAEDLRAADALYETKRLGINSGRANLQNWYTIHAGQNAKSELANLPAPANYATGNQPAPQKPAVPKLPATPGGPASSPQYQARLPASATHVNTPVPATTYGGGTYASGSPPGKGYKWNGVRWVKK